MFKRVTKQKLITAGVWGSAVLAIAGCKAAEILLIAPNPHLAGMVALRDGGTGSLVSQALMQLNPGFYAGVGRIWDATYFGSVTGQWQFGLYALLYAIALILPVVGLWRLFMGSGQASGGGVKVKATRQLVSQG